ncbi:MAG TPA: DNA gyrase inhibitor YacG [Planctomycetaceae bacterium]|nr:DNA gyrase inhibitor YacG [Planctomycetaceae bacterium]
MSGKRIRKEEPSSGPGGRQRLSCPTCGQEFVTADSPALPFCSDRCRSIDLKRWLGEEYGIPVESTGEEDSV